VVDRRTGFFKSSRVHTRLNHMKFLFYDFPTSVRARDYVGLDVEPPISSQETHPYAPHLDAKMGQNPPPTAFRGSKKLIKGRELGKGTRGLKPRFERWASRITCQHRVCPKRDSYHQTIRAWIGDFCHDPDCHSNYPHI